MELLSFLLILLILVIFLFLSFFFSGLETGLISIDQVALEHQAKRSRAHAALWKFVKQPDKFLGTTLIGNNVANAILASVSTLVVHSLASLSFDARYTSLFIGTCVLIFGEIVPKAVFRDHADTLVLKLYPILMFFYFLFRPMVVVVGWLNRTIRKMLKLEEYNQYDYLTKDDISFFLSQAAGDKISAPQLEMIEDEIGRAHV